MAEDASSGGWSTIESDEVSDTNCDLVRESVILTTVLTSLLRPRACSRLSLSSWE